MKVCGIFTKEWNELCGIRKHGQERSKLLKANLTIFSIQENMPSLKTTDLLKLEANLMYVAKHMPELLDFYLSRKYMSQRL
mmetsp:Transcript_5936/g.11395  ORF Transcript_5936/g.11395 Transcript_5936/m.11395 type:complete len:81 (+) Transcript_5936:628-870(+)